MGPLAVDGKARRAALPATFPEKYRTAVVRAAEGCKVKKTIAAAPLIEVVVAQPGVGLAQAS